MPAGRSGLAEHLEILLAVGADLLKRFYPFRLEYAGLDVSELHLNAKVAKRMGGQCAEYEGALTERDRGVFEDFSANAHLVVQRVAPLHPTRLSPGPLTRARPTQVEPLYCVLRQMLEFREHATVLLHEMSTSIVKLSLDTNPLLFSSYYTLMMHYIRLHLVLGAHVQPAGQGTVALAAYAKAHSLLNAGKPPRAFDDVATYVSEYEHAVSRLQHDMTKARLRVAGTLIRALRKG